tara:strand:- start:470 stop:628 length:159 start_codon:yes stop_codon:yes gene_type:complete
MEGFKDLSPDAKVRYRKMIEQHNANQANKDKNKNKGKSKLQIFAEKLYGGGK